MTSYSLYLFMLEGMAQSVAPPPQPKLALMLSHYVLTLNGENSEDFRKGQSGCSQRSKWLTMSCRNKFTVAVEGNIGSGKTTLLQHFSNFPDIQVYQEPVEKWRNLKGNNLLELMYQDPSRWSLTFQTYVQLTMLDTHKCAYTKRLKMMERSIYSAKYCFVENLYRNGHMPKVEYTVLSEWFDWIIKEQDIPLDLIVYLRTTPETVYSRINARSRKEERTISKEYLQSLHNLHENWLIHQKEFPLPAPVLVLDANGDTEKMNEIFNEYSKRILLEDVLTN